jgi:hypothetical protein
VRVVPAGINNYYRTCLATSFSPIASRVRSGEIPHFSPMARARRVEAGCVIKSSVSLSQCIGASVMRCRLTRAWIAVSGSRVNSTPAASAAYSKRRDDPSNRSWGGGTR